jgi:protein SCO1/2
MIGEFLDNFKHTDFKAEQQKQSGDGSAIASFDRGKYVFARDCGACHTVGQGDKAGPDLLGVTKVRDHQWLMRVIQEPEQLLKESDPLATALLKKYNGLRMPNLSINNDELDLLIGYLQAESDAHDKRVAGADAVSKPADPAGGTAHPNR